jgi:hypothetical protein
MLVTKENWADVRKDLEGGVARVRLNDEGDMVWIATESFNGYNVPVRLLRKLHRDGELPEQLLTKLGKQI